MGVEWTAFLTGIILAKRLVAATIVGGWKMFSIEDRSTRKEENQVNAFDLWYCRFRGYMSHTNVSFVSEEASFLQFSSSRKTNPSRDKARQAFRFAWQEVHVDFCLVLYFAMFVLFAFMFFDPAF